ncbi:hypothetical protein [Nitrobacter sp. TKz-YC02]|uniref:hypothetical protein n=1 Tax=Nitrobacter sp. TKz-YC02 TaxID=3398704 RepID=UPI003CF56CA7
MRLTRAQLDLLTHAVAAGKATCPENYRPRRKLVDLGYATEHYGKYSDWIEPTDLGRAALAQSVEKK